ncbi:hypothetical protein [Pedobacter sp. GR22-10]|uniref:hypothetical protein n=1 Tax=Pedobacter sp. GR22-10 TaxID=2994472 RepID=UPI002245485C|nr:hypothetical protein [Pedobacter sp. GR22-10]MCX2429917.1 hypothetical protein [Pedobacter sp. GR22-10]
MKKPNVIQRIVQLLRVLNHFISAHSAVLSALKDHTIYFNDGHGSGHPGIPKTMKITMEGSLYRVTETSYLNEKPFGEKSWLATYGWHSNGHLIEIGGNRYCIFDSINRRILIEEEVEYGYQVEEFVQQ